MLFPITFSIPEEKIITYIPTKTKLLANIIPGKLDTYIYDKEETYYNDYRESIFGITMKKAGWDCIRHYEIIANGCIPIFYDIENCPPNTLALLPKDLLFEGIKLYSKLKDKTQFTEDDIHTYNELIYKLLDHTRKNLTTEKLANYILEKTNYKNVKNVLYLSGDLNPDYLRCLVLNGFKKVFGKNCHDYPKIPHIYKSNIDSDKLYGKGFTYSKLVDDELRDDELDNNLIDKIKNKYFDIIIYGSYHRGMPHYDLICEIYKPDEIILLCGEDIHNCDYNNYVEKGHHVFVREL